MGLTFGDDAQVQASRDAVKKDGTLAGPSSQEISGGGGA